MKKTLTATLLSLSLIGCGASSFTPTTTYTDETRPIVCVISFEPQDKIDATAISIAQGPPITLLSIQTTDKNQAYKFCTKITVTDITTGDVGEAPAEFIVQRDTNKQTYLVNMSTKSFVGQRVFTSVSGVGVGGTTLSDGTFAFQGLSNNVKTPLSWRVQGWRQRF